MTEVGDLVGRRYLDLLMRSLTNTLFHDEPDVEETSAVRLVTAQIGHYQESDAVSMLPLARMRNIETCIRDVVANGVPGDLIETGVWRGGATIFMRAALDVTGDMARIVWVADSFEGLPEPDAGKFPLEAKSFRSGAMMRHYKHFAVGLEDVENNFRLYGLLDDRVNFLRGWFKDTLPTAPIGKLAVMRLDGDYYESTWDALINLYDKLSVGGYVIIDDYGEDDWTYCRKAVEDFRRAREIIDPLVPVDRRCSYWQKTK